MELQQMHKVTRAARQKDTSAEDDFIPDEDDVCEDEDEGQDGCPRRGSG